MTALSDRDHDRRRGLRDDDPGGIEVRRATAAHIVRETVRFIGQADEASVELAIAVHVMKDGDGIRAGLHVPDAQLDRSRRGPAAILVGAGGLAETRVADPGIDHALIRLYALCADRERCRVSG